LEFHLVTNSANISQCITSDEFVTSPSKPGRKTWLPVLAEMIYTFSYMNTGPLNHKV